MSSVLWGDTETRSERDLKQHGSYVYAEHPSTDILTLQWAFGDGPVVVNDFTDPDMDLTQYVRFLNLATNPAINICFHNTAFDQGILRRCLGLNIPDERLIDSAALCRAVGLPGKLELACPAAGVPAKYQKKDGDKLIRKFCMPQKVGKIRWRDRYTDPEDWKAFIQYGIYDIISMRELVKRLPQSGAF